MSDRVAKELWVQANTYAVVVLGEYLVEDFVPTDDTEEGSVPPLPGDLEATAQEVTKFFKSLI